MFRSIVTAATAGPSRLGPLVLSRGFYAAAVARDKRPAAPRLKQGLPADSVKARQALNEETKQWIEGMYGGEGSWVPQNWQDEAATRSAGTPWDETVTTPQRAASKEERTQRRRERRANKRGRVAQARAARVASVSAAAPVGAAEEISTSTGTGGSDDPTAERELFEVSLQLTTGAPARRWEPTRKLTYAAMAGVRELHAQDPQTWTRAALAEKFGVSFEAVGRILRSKWHDKRAASASVPDMGKWAKGESSEDSPVPYIRAVYDLKRRSDAGEGGSRTRPSSSKSPKDP